jgi:TRAP transporter 4TM/12TM fusion protein
LGGLLTYGIAVTFSLFQLWTAAYSPLPSQIVRSVHVGFLLLLLFGVLANGRPGRRDGFALDWAAGVLSFVVGLLHWAFYDQLIFRAGDPLTTDIVVGVITIILVFIGAWRLMGGALPIMCAFFLGYALFGQYLPYPLNDRGYDFAQVVDQMFLGTEGIYGIPTYVSSSYIFLFILFGAFVERAGMIRLFTDVLLELVGQSKGRPAKVAVISSGLMGTINGSGVAKVVTIGQFTIPLMKRFGYRAEFAGAGIIRAERCATESRESHRRGGTCSDSLTCSGSPKDCSADPGTTPGPFPPIRPGSLFPTSHAETVREVHVVVQAPMGVCQRCEAL